MPIHIGSRPYERVDWFLYQPLHPGVLRLIKPLSMLAMNKVNLQACVVNLLGPCSYHDLYWAFGLDEFP